VLGDVARATGDPATAEGYYRDSYAIREEFDDPEGMAVALHHLGELALQRQDYTKAQALYGQSLGMYQKLNDQGRIGTSLRIGDHTISAKRGYMWVRIAQVI